MFKGTKEESHKTLTEFSILKHVDILFYQKIKVRNGITKKECKVKLDESKKQKEINGVNKLQCSYKNSYSNNLLHFNYLYLC